MIHNIHVYIYIYIYIYIYSPWNISTLRYPPKDHLTTKDASFFKVDSELPDPTLISWKREDPQCLKALKLSSDFDHANQGFSLPSNSIFVKNCVAVSFQCVASDCSSDLRWKVVFFKSWRDSMWPMDCFVLAVKGCSNELLCYAHFIDCICYLTPPQQHYCNFSKNSAK